MQEEPTLEALQSLIEEGDNIKVEHMKDVLQLVKPAKKAKAAPKKKAIEAGAELEVPAELEVDGTKDAPIAEEAAPATKEGVDASGAKEDGGAPADNADAGDGEDQGVQMVDKDANEWVLGPMLEGCPDVQAIGQDCVRYTCAYDQAP